MVLPFIKYFFHAVVSLSPVLIFLVILIVSFGLIIGRLEKWTKFDAVYYAFVTATTVGYGDLRPQKKGSKILSVLIAFVGIIFTGIIVALGLHVLGIVFQEAKQI